MSTSVYRLVCPGMILSVRLSPYRFLLLDANNTNIEPKDLPISDSMHRCLYEARDMYWNSSRADLVGKEMMKRLTPRDYLNLAFKLKIELEDWKINYVECTGGKFHGHSDMGFQEVTLDMAKANANFKLGNCAKINPGSDLKLEGVIKKINKNNIH
ncbi:hypothetical protein [Thioclava kandeliae]|uniref:Uncharacterized protein n=1 Tax=Thioclava kandeliae TaxID=3070818 RepID=A0ABV1SL83_9RHOB